jgi:flagellar motor switch protein FliM
MKERTEMEYAEEIETTLTKVDVPVTAILGNSTISVADFSSLQVGDVVRLDSKVNQELTVYVGETEKFTALPGAVGDKYAVRITSVIREEQ